MRLSIRTCALVMLAAVAVASPFPSLVAAPAQPSNPSGGRLVVAVVRNDALLLPFAAFDGRKWSAPWPGAVDGPGAPELPVNLASVPAKWWGGEAPGPWNLWPRGAEAATRIALQSPVMIRVGASRQLGFRTDQPPVLPPVPPFELPFPKIGIAIAGDAQLGPVPSVSPLTPPWRAFTTALREDIDKAEERSIQTLRGSARWNHPFKPDARGKLQPELEAWYLTRLADSSVSLSYVEAVKKYPVLPADDGCGLETFVSGWVFHEEGKKPRSRLKAVITYCDRRSVSYMLPFGQLTLAGRTHWIVQMSGRDLEWYAVIEGRSDEVKYVVEHQAGRLPLN
jgi:hypothetical protein